MVLEETVLSMRRHLQGRVSPVGKNPGDAVSAATVNQSGFIRCEATRVGEDTTLSQIIKMVSDAAATKHPIAKIADRVSGVFLFRQLSVLRLSPPLSGCWQEKSSDMHLPGISVLVISCPCAREHPHRLPLW